ncbi:GNAT family N-acetyltransferase [Propionivibrio dicarboxylicus]|uniref:GNAT family N-acetyltransferase n=1 Tax=Propionivibrio dicarboxylicus TaxID=83767 RepID=UPI000B841A66|nr:GNAT family N-acetyltransferase [Propionivibrio dicarboxylicus]
MKINKDIIALIESENSRHCGGFVRKDLGEYLTKISTHAEVLSLYNSDSLLGFVFFYCNDPNKILCYLSLICVADSARKTGVGQSLLDYSKQICKSKGFQRYRLEVLKVNNAAIRFYSKNGFRVVDSSEDSFFMEVELI